MDSPPSISIAAATSNLNLGGSTTFLLNLARAICDPPHQLRIIGVTEGNELAADFSEAGADVITMAPRRVIYEDRLLWAYRQIAQAQPNALLACLGSEAFEMLRLAPRGVARIGLIQSDDPGPYAMLKRYAPWLDAAVGVSAKIAGTLRTMPEFSHTRVEHIPYGISFVEEHARLPRSPGEPLRVVYLGRLSEEQKRVSRLVALIRLLEAQGANIRFTIAGSGAQQAVLRDDLKSSIVTEFKGVVPNREVPSFLLQQDVFILLSDYEGLPLSLLEAMGYGLVPVVSDLPSGIGEALGESCGLRVPVGDIGAAASALCRLEALPGELARLSRAAQARARTHFSATAMAAKYLDLLCSLGATGSAPLWPAQVRIPAPLGLNPFLFSGLGRVARRFLNRVAHPEK